MSDRHLRPLSALAGIAVPGRFGRSGGEPGIVIEERLGLGLATVAARKGQAGALKAAVLQAYGVDLPDGSRFAQGPDCELCRLWPGPMARRIGKARQ